MVISTAFAVIPGTDSVLILESKTLREKLGIDVMASLKAKAQGGDRSSGDMPEDVDSRGGISLRRVAVTMKGMRLQAKWLLLWSRGMSLLKMWWRGDRQCLWRLAMK